MDNSVYNCACLGGDINIDLSKNGIFEQLVRDRLQLLGLKTTWTKFKIDFTYMHYHTTAEKNLRTNTSTIDHFMCNMDLLNTVSDAVVLHFAETLEDHSPIYMKVPVGKLEFPRNPPNSKQSRPAWFHAKRENIEGDGLTD